MSRPAKNIIGQKFGKLIVLHSLRLEHKRGMVWLTRCECGQTREVLATRLLNRAVKQCEECTERMLPYRGRWKRLLPELTPRARAYFEEIIGRRRKLGIRISSETYAEAVDVAIREYPKAA